MKCLLIGIEECAKLGRRAHEADFEIEGEMIFGLSHMGPARARQRRLTVRRINCIFIMEDLT